MLYVGLSWDKSSLHFFKVIPIEEQALNLIIMSIKF